MLYENDKQLIESLKEQANAKLKSNIVNLNKKSISKRDITNLLIDYCDIRRIYLTNENHNMAESTFAIYNYQKKAYDLHTSYLERLINIICKELNLDITTQFISSIYLMLSRDEDIPKFNQAPYYLLKFNNGILNFKTKEFIGESNSEHEYFKYDYLAITQYDYIPYVNQSEELKEVVSNIFNIWSNNDEHIKKFLLQICASVLDGDGRGSFIILQSPGGDGKSSFMKINSYLAGQSNILDCNLDELSDDNVLNQVNLSTKAIKGDDLTSNFKLTGKNLSILKSLTSFEYVQVGQKYLENKKIRTKALIIQNTNTNIKFFENSNAINRRMIYYIWPTIDFHNNSNSINLNGYQLKDLLTTSHEKHKLFIETIISYIFEKIDYFTEFSKPQNTNEINELMMSQSDSVYQFIEELIEDGYLQYQKIIISKVLYGKYKDWLKINNPAAKVMSLRSFSIKLQDELNKRFAISKLDVRLRNKSIKLSEFNPFYLFSENDINPDFKFKSSAYQLWDANDQSTCLINNDIKYDQNKINLIKQSIIDNESLLKYEEDYILCYYAILQLIDDKQYSKLSTFILRYNLNEFQLKQLTPIELRQLITN